MLELAKALRLPLRLVGREEMLARGSDALTQSPAAAVNLGVAVSPAAAAPLAAAGPRSRLILPRLGKGFVTRALAGAGA